MKRCLINKINAVISIVLLMTTLFGVPAAASSKTLDSWVAPCNIDIELLTASLSIDNNGKASCDGFVRARVPTNVVYLTMTLQRTSGGGWNNVKSWSTSGTSSAALAEEWYVVSGYTYRVKVTASDYTSSGSFIEQLTVYSGNKNY